jgi:hypothetical protein
LVARGGGAAMTLSSLADAVIGLLVLALVYVLMALAVA